MFPLEIVLLGISISFLVLLPTVYYLFYKIDIEWQKKKDYFENILINNNKNKNRSYYPATVRLNRKLITIKHPI